MTTWHANESLEEAAWYFKYCAIPYEEHVQADFERFAVSVANPKWDETLRRSLLCQGKKNS